MEATVARAALRQYREDLKASRQRSRTEIDRELVAIDDAVMRGYRELGKGRRVIELSKAIAAGGTVQVADCTGRYWNDGQHEIAVDVLAPGLAVTRADARSCWIEPLLSGNRVRYQADGWAWSRRRGDELQIDDAFDIDIELELAGLSYDRNERAAVSGMRLKAMAPTIPPALRPPHHLRNYHLLWEAEWTVGSMIPPGDPALLKHLGGDMFAVLAVWDLSPLERAALAQVRT
jgi:hypothetical protein